MQKIILSILLFLGFNSSTILAAVEANKADSASTTRFILNEGQVYDQDTKLTWSRCSVGAVWEAIGGCVGRVKLMRFSDARRAAEISGNGWRIPTIEELYSLVDHKRSSPLINPEVFQIFKNTEEPMSYWSRSNVEGIPSLIYFIDFTDGSVDGHTKSFRLAVLLVRSER